PNSFNTNRGISKNEYLSLCQQFVDACSNHKAQSASLTKVVLSRIKKIELDSNFSIQNYFTQLCTHHKHAFNYFVHIPDICSWIGSTPEELVVEKEDCYTTMSLAGTRSVDDSLPF